jgi:hypothetical protein
MAPPHADQDYLGTIERCVAALRGKAEAAGIVLDLVVSVNPALVRSDATALNELGRDLLRHAISETRRGHRLRVRVDMDASNTITLKIDEEDAQSAQGPTRNSIRHDNEWVAGVERARMIAASAGGGLSVSRESDGRLHLCATLPTAMP